MGADAADTDAEPDADRRRDLGEGDETVDAEGDETVDAEKAYAYATRRRNGSRELLVFEHRDRDAGVQVPKGTVDDGEDPADAVVRELEEESGVTDVRSVTHLATDDWYYPKRDRVYRRYFYHLPVDADRDAWDHVVSGGGIDDGMVFRCRFVALDDVSLVNEMDQYLGELPDREG